MARILVTNDDGYRSPGLRYLVRALSDLGDLTIICPEQQRSAAGLSVTLHKPLRLRKIVYDNHLYYLMNGTTGDCVSMGLFHIMDEPPDITVSGINIGENISLLEFFMSGTVAGALLSALHNIPSISFSKVVLKADVIGGEMVRGGFEAAALISREIVKIVLEDGLPDNIDLYNVNFPNRIASNSKIVVTRPARLSLNTKLYIRRDPRGREYYWLWGEKFKSFPRGTDGYEVFINGNISLTPISLSNISYESSSRKLKHLVDSVNDLIHDLFK
ncbi:MAG TPA: 5'/3'-nucleotidase SurE [Thermoprotei archaeon]|nr:5'/3'-nucleotidase SurE [Thermoprotei archaeon]